MTTCFGGVPLGAREQRAVNRESKFIASYSRGSGSEDLEFRKIGAIARRITREEGEVAGCRVRANIEIR